MRTRIRRERRRGERRPSLVRAAGEAGMIVGVALLALLQELRTRFSRFQS